MLTIDSVSYSYRTKYQTVQAVKEVSASFEPGRFYAIMGPSGSGKTTLLSLMAGLALPSSGEIRFDEQSTAELDRDDYRKQHVSVIYQDFNLFAHLTVLENAAYPLYLRGKSKHDAEAAAREKLLTVGLDDGYLGRLPNMLSGGEQQRVAIARALVTGSDLILADEPTGNLDGENSRNIVGILKTLAHEHDRCVVVVTHDQAVADEADVTLIMRDGRIAE